MANNRNLSIDVRYKMQQEAIKEVCEELGLVAFYPNYHSKDRDCNTVLVYTQEAHKFNEALPYYASYNEYAPYICSFENTNCNGWFDLNWLNHGKIDCRDNVKAKIKAFIEASLITNGNKRNQNEK